MTPLFRYLAAFALFAVPAMAAGQTPAAPDLSAAPRITLEEFKKIHDANAVLVVDVRDAESFAQGHIPGAILVPLAQVTQQLKQLKASPKPIVTYCA
jgi:3-mercaptopyruvate sulfurtransferase SseA